MRGKMLLVSAVIALVAFSGVLLAMTSEEISKLPLKERMKYEEEIRIAEQANQYPTVDRVDGIRMGSIQNRGRFDYTIEWFVDCSPQSMIALGTSVVDDTLLWVTAGGIVVSGDPNWVFIYNLNTVTCIDSFLQPTATNWGWRDLTYDGTYLYASDGTGIDKIDPATHSVVETIYPATGLSTHRALACDGDSIWAADWASSIWKFAIDGSNAHSYFNDQSLYGLAYDPAGFIWGSAQEGVDGNTVVKYNASDLTVIEAMVIPEVGLAGGCELYRDSLLLYVDQNLSHVVAIRVHFPVYDHDVGALSIIEPSGTYTSGTVVAPRTRIKNNGTNEETFDTYFKIYDGTKAEVYSEVINTTLSPGVQDTLVFPDFTIDEGSFEAVSYTDLTGDENPANDTATSTFGAISFVEDFESGEWPPYGWETYMTGDVVDNHGWQSLYDGCPDFPNCLPYEGDYGAWHQDDYVTCEDWLVSPPLIVGSGASISFYHNEYFGSWYEYHGIWASTGSPDPADGDFVEVEAVPPIPSPYGWEPYGPVDLSAYDGQNMYIAFKYEGDGADHWYLDYITGTAISVWRPDHDVGVTEIIRPGATQVVGDSIYPEVEVKNFGLNPEVFDVTLEIYGATKQEYTSTVMGVSVDPGMTQIVDFADVWAPTTDGAYDVIAYTLLGTDEVPSNDTSETSVMVVGWVEDFEDTDGGFVADPMGGWQWGTPTYGPGGAHSGENLWATNLSGDYVAYADWRLERNFYALSDNPVLSFYHWYDTEGYFDGGNVKISTDGGVNWVIVGSYLDPYNEDAASSGNEGIPGEPCFSGHGQGYWELVAFDLSADVDSGDIFGIRWHFGSDVSGQYAGWYIDDVSGVGFIPFIPSHDVGVSEIVTPTGIIYDGDVVTPEVVVENLGSVPDTVDVTLDISPPVLKSRQVYHEVVTAVVDAETTLAVTFPEWTAIAGSYDVTAYTTLASDENPVNDTMTTSLIVGSWVEDFEEGTLPLGWADYQLGEEAGWELVEDSTEAYSGAYYAYHDYWSGSPNDWLVTAAYSVGPNAQAYFYQKDNYSGDYVYHGIWVSTGSGVPDADFSELMELGAATEDVWSIYGPVDLSVYEGEQIYLGFVYQGYFADEWFIDDVIGINLSSMIPYNVVVVGVPNGAVGDTIPQGSLLHPSCVVANNSPVASGLELSFRVHYKVQKDGNLYWHRVYDVMNLPASAEETIYFPGDVVLNEPGDYTITVTIQTAFDDPILANNTSVRYIHVTSDKGGAQELPRVFALNQNAPNPARANTSICYAIPRTSDVSIRIFDVSGRLVRTLVEATKEPGYYTENWDLRDDRGREIASGIYFYELNAGNFKSVKKMVVMR